MTNGRPQAGLPYRVESTPFRDRDAGHFAHQPFGQAPWLTDGDIDSQVTPVDQGEFGAVACIAYGSDRR